MFDKISRVIAVMFGTGAIICFIGCCSINDEAADGVIVLIRCMLLAMLCIALSGLFYDWALTRAKFTALVVVALAAIYPKARNLRAASRSAHRYRKQFQDVDNMYSDIVTRSLQYDEQRQVNKAIRKLDRVPHSEIHR